MYRVRVCTSALAHRELRPPVPLPVRGAMRQTIRAQPAGQRARVAPLGLHGCGSRHHVGGGQPLHPLRG